MQIMSVLLVFLFKVGSWTEGGRAPHSVFDQCMGESHETPWMHLKLRMLSSMENNAEPLSHHPLGKKNYTEFVLKIKNETRDGRTE